MIMYSHVIPAIEFHVLLLVLITFRGPRFPMRRLERPTSAPHVYNIGVFACSTFRWYKKAMEKRRNEGNTSHCDDTDNLSKNDTQHFPILSMVELKTQGRVDETGRP